MNSSSFLAFDLNLINDMTYSSFSMFVRLSDIEIF